MNPNIPGFYYDPEKRKYFKIEANHVAPPGSQYSVESVKRKRTEEEKYQKVIRFSQRVSRETVRKAVSLNHPLVGVGREIASRMFSPTATHEQQARAYASQLWHTKLHKFQTWPNEYTIRHVLRNPDSGVLIASRYIGKSSSVSVCFPDIDEERWTYNSTKERVLFRERARISSIALSHTGYLLTTLDSSVDGSAALMPRLLPHLDETIDHYLMPVHSLIRFSPTIWCSAACPTGTKALFAVGTSDGLHTLEGSGDHWTLSQKPLPNEANTGHQGFRRHGDSSDACVKAVEWLTSDLIASGLRNSTVFLHDLRSGGSAVRLQHPHSVDKIRKVDPYRLVVGGYNSLQMYDIRFAPNGLQQKPNPISRSHDSTRPYLTFVDYSPDTIPDFDVSSELGLLARATDDRKVQLFSLRTGTQVSSPLSKYRYRERIACVCFESGQEMDRHGPQGPSLLICSEATVHQWTL